MGNWLGRKKVRVEEEFTRPQGIHQQPFNVDYKKLRRLIRSGKLAPCFPGQDEGSPELEECPICFYYFPSLNRSRCCTKGICTECFLQMKPQDATRSALCPFCKSGCYVVEYRGARTQEEKSLEIAEEQKVIEAQLRMQYEELQFQKSQPPAPSSFQMEFSGGDEGGNLEQPPLRSLPDPPAETMAVTTATVLSDHESRVVGSPEEAMMLVQAIWLSVQVFMQSTATADVGLCSDRGSWESAQLPNQAAQSGDIPVCEQTSRGNSVHEASELRDNEASSRNISDNEQCSRSTILSNDSSLTEHQSVASWCLHSASVSDSSSSSRGCHNECNHLPSASDSETPSILVETDQHGLSLAGQNVAI